MNLNPKNPLAALLLACCTALGHAAAPAASFADDPAVIDFARDLEQRHGFNADTLLGQFAETRPNAKVLQLIKPPSSPLQRSWERYRPRFLNDRRIDGGVGFWLENEGQLIKASALYGVPPEIIVAIIGVETEYGRNTGGFRVLEALATLAFKYPPRAEFFRTELEQFLLLSRENNLDPLTVKGSFAGAIGSVARFLEQHGWQAGQPIAVQAATNGAPDPALLQAGIRPSLRVGELADKGVRADTDLQGTVALIDLVSPNKDTESWLGFENFYVITRYNRSSFYAMSVFQLGEEIRNRLCAQLPATAGNRARYCRA